MENAVVLQVNLEDGGPNSWMPSFESGLAPVKYNISKYKLDIYYIL